MAALAPARQRGLAPAEAPAAWVEMLFHRNVAAQILGRPVAGIAAENPGISDQIEVCQRLGLCAVGLPIYGRYGSHMEATGASYHWVPHILDWDHLPRLQFPIIDPAALAKQMDDIGAQMAGAGLAFFPAGMFCVATSMNDMGFENFCTKLHDDPRLVSRVMAGYAEHNGRLLEFYSSRPEVDFVWIADDVAYGSSTFFSPRVFRQHIFPIWREMAACIRKPWIFHSDGNLLPILDELLSLDMAGLHPIEAGAMDIYELKRQVGKDVALVGNVDMGLLTSGTPAEVEGEALALLESLSAGGGYIVSSGNSISVDCRPENVVAIGDALRRWNSQFA